MSELLGMSFDAATSPSVRLSDQETAATIGDNGWGFGWFPDGDVGAAVLKDPDGGSIELFGGVLRDWQRFRSTSFLCHVLSTGRRSGQENTHPFCRIHAGNDFLFAHDGQLDPAAARDLPLGPTPVFEPVGRTDSERAFCWLLTKMRDRGARRLADIGWDTLHGWLRELNQMGSLNLLLADRSDLVAYRDAHGHRSLTVTRRVPPHNVSVLHTRIVDLDLSHPLDQNRTMVLIASHPSDDVADWRAMGPSEMIVTRRGTITWQSQPLPGDPNATAYSPGADGFAAQTGGAQPAWAETTMQQAASFGNGTNVPPPPPLVVDQWPPNNQPPGPPIYGQAPVQPASPPTSGDPVTTSRLLRVTHTTSYQYDSPVERSSHLFRLRPVNDSLQQLLEHQLTVTPAGGERADFEDVFGNYATRLEQDAPYAEMTLTATSLVRVHLDPPQASVTRRTSIPLVWMPWQRQMMDPYLLPPELPESQLRELSDFAMSFAERQDHGLLETLRDINNTIRNDFSYVSKSTTLETTPFDVYSSRQGVCQDFSNLFICLARLLGVPARYRVGYIRPIVDPNNPQQAAESHAWVEVYLPWAGWRGYDPTNGCLAGLDHVRVAVGRNYRDATPTSGTIYKGGAGESLTIAVHVDVVDG